MFMESIIYVPSGTIAEDRERDNLRAEIAKQDALIDYLSMMADIDLPTDDEDGGVEDESEI